MSARDDLRREHSVARGSVHRAVDADAEYVDAINLERVNRDRRLVNLIAVDALPTPGSVKRLKHASAVAARIENRALGGIRGKAPEVRRRSQLATGFPRHAAVCART